MKLGCLDKSQSGMIVTFLKFVWEASCLPRYLLCVKPHLQKSVRPASLDHSIISPVIHLGRKISC